MALQTSGPISLGDLRTEFGGGAPDSLSEYYAGGAYVNSSTTSVNHDSLGNYIPSSGTISLSDYFGAAENLSLTYRAYYEQSANAQNRTWPNCDIGLNPSSSRLVVCRFSTNNDSPLTSADIGGINATILAYHWGSTASRNNQFFAAVVPSGTTATINTYQGGVNAQGHLSTWEVTNWDPSNPLTAYATGFHDGGVTTPNTTITIPRGGVAFAAVANSSGATYTWNIREVNDVAGEAGRFSAADQTRGPLWGPVDQYIQATASSGTAHTLLAISIGN